MIAIRKEELGVKKVQYIYENGKVSLPDELVETGLWAVWLEQYVLYSIFSQISQEEIKDTKAKYQLRPYWLLSAAF